MTDSRLLTWRLACEGGVSTAFAAKDFLTVCEWPWDARMNRPGPDILGSVVPREHQGLEGMADYDTTLGGRDG